MRRGADAAAAAVCRAGPWCTGGGGSQSVGGWSASTAADHQGAVIERTERMIGVKWWRRDRRPLAGTPEWRDDWWYLPDHLCQHDPHEKNIHRYCAVSSVIHVSALTFTIPLLSTFCHFTRFSTEHGSATPKVMQASTVWDSSQNRCESTKFRLWSYRFDQVEFVLTTGRRSVPLWRWSERGLNLIKRGELERHIRVDDWIPPRVTESRDDGHPSSWHLLHPLTRYVFGQNACSVSLRSWGCGHFCTRQLASWDPWSCVRWPTHLRLKPQ